MLNPQVQAGTLQSLAAFAQFQTFYSNFYDTLDSFDPDLARQAKNRDDAGLRSVLRVILGNQLQFGVDNEMTRLLAAIAPASLTDALSAVFLFTNSGALAAASELVALVTNGQISAANAMAAADAVAPFLDTTRLVYFLASLAAAPSLQVAAPQEIDKLVHDGKLSGTAALAAIAAITGAAPSGGSIMASITLSTAVAALIGVYSNAQDPAFATAIAQQLAGIFTHPPAGYTQAALLIAINAAVSGNEISATTATNLLLQLAVAAQLPPTSSSFATIIADISSYITNNGVSVTSVVSTALASANSLATAAATGALVGKIENSTRAIADIAAAASSHLTPQQEAAALLGLLPGATTPSAITTIRSDLIALVTSHAVNAPDLVPAMLAAGTSVSDVFAVLLGLAKAEPGTAGDVAAAFASFVGSNFGPSNDRFFGDPLTLSGIDFVNVMNGTMTTDQAIQDVESFNSIHGNSADAGLLYLSQLFGAEEGALFNEIRSGTDPNPDADATLADTLSAAQQTINDEIQNRVADGASASQLAQHMGQALASGGAITFTLSQAQDLYQQLGGGANLLSNATFAIDVPTERVVYQTSGYSYPGNFIPYQLVGLSTTDVHNIYNTQTSGYLIDQALAGEIYALNNVGSPSAAAARDRAVKGLALDLTNGYAETNIINEIQSGELTPEQGIAALESLLAPVLAQEQNDPNLAQWTRDIAYAWLGVKASEFIQGNYKIIATTDSAGKHQTIQVLASPVNELFADLVGQYQNTLLSGLGALNVLNGTPGISGNDLTVAYNLTSYIFQQAAAASPGNDPNTVLFGFSSARNFFIGGAQLLAKSRAAQQDPTSIPGVASGLILHEGKSVEDYVDFGSRVLGLLASRGDTGINALILGPGGASIIGPLGIFATVMTVVLSIGAVSDALGARTTSGLKGWYDLQAQVANLAGNIVAGIAKGAADQVIKGAEGLGLSFKDLFTGNFSDLATDSANLGEALFTLSTGGFDVNAVAGTFSDFGVAMANLFSGSPSSGDFAVLGPDLLKVMTSNVFIASALSAFENFGLNVWNDAINIVAAIEGVDPNGPPPPSEPPPPPVITLPNGRTIVMGNDPYLVGGKAYQDPTSTSNYGTFYHGAAIDGYIGNATVFIDTNGNGTLDPGEYSTITDASGNYALPQGISGTVIVTAAPTSPPGCR